ncbi:MAG: YfhO family protein, partial [Anaerolineae bacterium]
LLLFGLLPAPVAHNLSVLWPFFVAAFGTYALARRLGASLWPSLVAAVAYALGGFYIVHVKHAPIVQAACWIPLVWLLVELGLHRDRRLLLALAPLWAIQWLAGMPQMAYYSVGLGLLYYLGRALQGRQVRRTAPLLVAALILSFGLAAVQLWPTAELVGYSERAGGVSFEFASAFAYRMQNLRTWLYPYANGDPGTASYRLDGLFWEDYAYVGLLPLLAGLAGGAWLARRRGAARLLLLLGVATFLLALGKNTPLFALAYDWLPGMNLFRFPQRLLAVTSLCLALLAALSLTQAEGWLVARAPAAGRPAGRLLLGLAMLLPVAADLYVYHVRQNAFADMDAWYAPPETARTITAAEPLAPAPAGAGLDRVVSVGAITRFRETYREAGGWEGDLTPYLAQREFLQPSLNVLYGVASADGYANLTPAYLTQVWGNEKQAGLIKNLVYRYGEELRAWPGFRRLLSLYNVRYLITHMPFHEDGFDLIGVYGPGAHLYENRDVLPRAFVVPTYTLASDLPAVLERLVAPEFDPRSEVVLLGDLPGGGTMPAGGSPRGDFASSARISDYEPQRVAVEVESNAAGFLVLSDLYYPGWQATVDGQPSPIYQADACIRAVPVEAGAHRVEFAFRPLPLRRGALISGLSLAALAVTWWLASGKLAAGSEGLRTCLDKGKGR